MHEIWSVDSQEKYYNCCQQCAGAYSAPADPLAGFKGPTSKWREGRKEEGKKG